MNDNLDSTNNALISTTKAIKSQIDNGNFMGDLQKAFDTVNHDILWKTCILWLSRK